MRKHYACLAIFGTAAILLGGAAVALALYRPDLGRAALYRIDHQLNHVDAAASTIVRQSPADTPYDRWFATARSSMPTIDGMVVHEIGSIALSPWPDMGGGVNGLYMKFADYQIFDGRLLEIPAGGAARARRDMFEIDLYVLGGSGRTVLQPDIGPAQQVAWTAGSIVSVPLNVRYRHDNVGGGPARLLAITSFPFVLNMSDSLEFATQNRIAFRERYTGQDDFFRTHDRFRPNRTAINFIDDARAFPLHGARHRGYGATYNSFRMAGNTMLGLHLSDLSGRTRKKAHRHLNDALILIVSGAGFSVSWPGGEFGQQVRVDWRAGTLFVPPTFWYHQHFNPGQAPARYLAVTGNYLMRDLGLRFEDQIEIDRAAIAAAWRQALPEVAP